MLIHPCIKHSLGTADKEMSQTQPLLSSKRRSRGDRPKKSGVIAVMEVHASYHRSVDGDDKEEGKLSAAELRDSQERHPE